MAVRVGSARSDEYGGSGWDGRAKAGDQKNGNEVSAQDWYLHDKGWVVIRAKDATARKKIAYAMQRACDNNNIGYDQSQRDTAWDWCERNNNWDPGAINTPVETDCSSLVKLCCRYAGIVINGYFYTANETQKLKETGKFELLTSNKYTKSSDYLLAGDILNTKTQGHTVIVLNDGPKAGQTDPIPTYPTIGTAVAKQGMNVRTGDSTNHTIIGGIAKGETVQVIEQLPSGWLKIVWSKEQPGYAFVSNRGNIYFDVKIKSEFPCTVQVTANALYVRKGPGTQYSAVTVVHYGEKYVITGIENEKWAKLQNGKGYISMVYAKKV